MLLLTLLTVACDKDDVADDSYTHYLYDVMTYVGSDEATGCAQFELVGRDVSGSTMLTADVAAPEGTKPLQRMLVRYYYASPVDHRNINVYGMTKMITDSLRVGKAALSNYAMHQVKMRSAWRTGDFINLHCEVEHTGKARTLMLLIDDATRNQDTVHCYLHHDLGGADTVYYWRNCYASFNVGNVWKRTECKTMRIHVNDATTGDRCYDFDRK